MQDAKRAVTLTSPALYDNAVPSVHLDTRQPIPVGTMFKSTYWSLKRVSTIVLTVVIDSVHHSTAIRMVSSRE